MRIAIRFPGLSEMATSRPSRCDRCGVGPVYRHKRYRQRVRDPRVVEVETWQYRCRSCGRVMTHRPEGIGKSKQQSQRAKVASVVLYGLGLSYRKAADYLEGLGVKLHAMTIWRNVQEAGGKVRAAMLSWGNRGFRVQVLGADETVFKVGGEEVVVGFVVDPLHKGSLLGIEVLADRDSRGFIHWLRPYVEACGAEVLVTDDLDQYGAVSEELGKEHQLCLAHIRKSVNRRLAKIEGYEEDKAIIKACVKELSAQARQALARVHGIFRQAPSPLKGEHETPEYKLRMLTLELLEKWPKLTLYQKTTKTDRGIRRDQPRAYLIPSTNNDTERAIGLGAKIRYKLMRGYKSKASLINTCWLIALLAGLVPGLSLASLF